LDLVEQDQGASRLQWHAEEGSQVRDDSVGIQAAREYFPSTWILKEIQLGKAAISFLRECPDGCGLAHLPRPCNKEGLMAS
jgi:hypothetical protein